MKFFNRKPKYSTSRDYKPFDSLEVLPIIPVVRTVSSAAEPPADIDDGIAMSEQDKYYKNLNDDIAKAQEHLRVLESSVPVHCKRCDNEIERKHARWLDNALGVKLSGGYGMFVDEPDWKFYLCGPCTYGLFLYLRIDLSTKSWGEK